jgi:hypothetical protein
VVTGATVVVAETEGFLGLLALPVAAAAICGDTLRRATLQLELTLDLADIFGITFDPKNASDLWLLYDALSVSAQRRPGKSHDSGRGLVHRVATFNADEIGERIGARLASESVLLSILPFASVFTSSIGNWVGMRRFGETARRYMRYRRALEDTVAEVERIDRGVLDLLVEGIWVTFVADGRLLAEETAVLAGLLRRFEPTSQVAVQAQFVLDEAAWIERLSGIPEAARQPFLHALCVAATVDKFVSLPERKLLERTARELGLTLDGADIEALLREFERTGVVHTRRRARNERA